MLRYLLNVKPGGEPTQQGAEQAVLRHALDVEVEATQLAEVAAALRQPALEARPVHKRQSASAEAWRHQNPAGAVADPTHLATVISFVLKQERQVKEHPQANFSPKVLDFVRPDIIYKNLFTKRETNMAA